MDIEMVLVKGGWFEMGDSFGEGDWVEKPVHWLELDDFYIGKYPVTQEEYEAVMGKNPSFFRGDHDQHLPVERVTWNDAAEFCKRIGKRLPTEAEWEYAARSGGKKLQYATSTGDLSPELANYDKKVGKTTLVGSYPPNALGLYDMAGNVWEWVNDWYDEGYYQEYSKRVIYGDRIIEHDGKSGVKNPQGLRVVHIVCYAVAHGKVARSTCVPLIATPAFRLIGMALLVSDVCQLVKTTEDKRKNIAFTHSPNNALNTDAQTARAG